MLVFLLTKPYTWILAGGGWSGWKDGGGGGGGGGERMHNTVTRLACTINAAAISQAIYTL